MGVMLVLASAYSCGKPSFHPCSCKSEVRSHYLHTINALSTSTLLRYKFLKGTILIIGLFLYLEHRCVISLSDMSLNRL